jgi:hemerythrin-like domain-containing protein
MQKAISTIWNEHRSISAVLSALRALAKMAADPALQPDFAAFHAMVYYIDAFPERMHHPKEEEHLFARLLLRDPGSRTLISELQAEHATGAALVRDLERALLEFEQTWPRNAGRFAATVEAYAQFHWNHMRREENELIPRAEDALLPEDWAQIEAAFAGNHDPIADLREADFKALFQRVVSLAPEPIGLGARWKKTG